MLNLSNYKSFTTIDIETTGLEDNAEIIEIGLAHYENSQCVKTWQTLIKPSISIPHDITLLTGITNEMVSSAPSWKDIIKDFLEEIDGKLLIAHNKCFDQSHIEFHLGFHLSNLWLDTYDLAKILIPKATSYKLQNLAQFFYISDSNHHRALNDALVCGEVYLKLLELGSHYSIFTLSELSAFFQGDDNDLSDFFKVLELSSSNYLATPNIENKDTQPFNSQPDLSFLNATHFFQENGLLKKTLPAFEYRKEQIEMEKIIQKAFLDKKHGIIEAGTGTGKSFAYLVPSLLYGYEEKKTIIISTNTMALQEQLYYKDLPFLSETLNYPFKVTIAKGRKNYLCERRFNDQKKSKSLSKDEKLFTAGLIVWREEKTQFGDKEELNFNNLETQYWQRICSSSDTCFAKTCPYFNDCYYFNNKRKAQESNLIIVNHALLLQHLKNNHSILPDADQIIIDEAHHLEDEAIKQFTIEINLQTIGKELSTLTKSQGLLNRLEKQLGKNNFSEEGIITVTNQILSLKELEQSISQLISDTSFAANEIAILASNGEVRLTEKYRQSDWWEKLANKLNVLSIYLQSLLKKLKQIIFIIKDHDELEGLAREIDFIFTMFEEKVSSLNSFLQNIDSDLVYWLSAQNHSWGKNLILNMAHINISPLLKENLFSHYDSIILTSATLSTSKNLNYIANNFLLKDDEFYSYICPSPFDYEKQSFIITLNHRPDYNKVNELTYAKHLTEDIEIIAPVINGGMLILFTSYSLMNRVAYLLKDNKSIKDSFQILAHGQDGNRNTIISAMKANKNTIVLGTSTFWEGVDIPGDNLKAVFITKLPFLPPTMPIESARAELIERSGQSAFTHLSLPKAILKFRQGIGRLIRTKNDKGVIIIADNRISRKNYGKMFLNSLPNQSIISTDSIDAAIRISKWFEYKTK